MAIDDDESSTSSRGYTIYNDQETQLDVSSEQIDFEAEKESLRRRYENNELNRKEFAEKMGAIIIQECMAVRLSNILIPFLMYSFIIYKQKKQILTTIFL